ncbi:MAG TPA: response regulator [Patescibacteria group bacterium]|nr:response regulator [Patescibacteria group bacterium]
MTEMVLIVDDSLTVRKNLEEVFSSSGFHPVTCGSVAEARVILHRTPPAVVVLDVGLPDGDGITLLHEIRAAASHPGPVVLMLSTETEASDRIKGIKAGADEYVGKPYDSNHLITRTRELLRTRQTLPNLAPSPPLAAARMTAPVTILIIDENATFREQMREACDNAGYLVEVASTQEDGLRLAAASCPQAIIVDGVMPRIGGTVIIRRLRLDAALRGIPCLLLTPSEDQGAELRALDAGADAFVRKEEGVDIILTRLVSMLRRTAGKLGNETRCHPVLKRILAVDDSKTYLHALTDSLRIAGFEVFMANSGEEALELLAKQSVDCILLDLLMPGMGGREACRRIKSTPAFREIPLIMLTAIEDRSAMLDGLGAGADDFIAKSNELEVLKARVQAQIRRKQFEDENRRIREELLQKEIEAADARLVRKLAETRAVLIEELEAKNKELEAFSYSVAHDLRAPLRHIISFARILNEEIANRLNTNETKNLVNIRISAEKMIHLIDDLLVFSRNGRIELRKHQVSLRKIVQDARDELLPDVGKREVTWSIGELPDVNGDEALLKQVWLNLLSNAIKYTRSRDKAEITVGCQQMGAEVVCFVRDNGAGFDMKHSGKLFGIFQRLHRSSEFEGTGIGLANVRRIVERHGGRTWAEGAVGVGATVHFSLPVGSTQQ